MKTHSNKAIVAAIAATVAASFMFTGCEGRKMSNMTPDGETVEVIIGEPDADSPQTQIADDSASDNNS